MSASAASCVLFAVVLAHALPSPAVALADEPATSPKRRLPAYSGLAEPGPTAVEIVAWVPRVVLFPAWVVAELVIRRPLGWLIVTGERNNWASGVLSFFQRDVGIVPTFYADLGFRPYLGFYFFWDRAGHPRHALRARASGTVDAFALSFADRWQTDDAGSRCQLQADASLQSDRAFYGIGPRTLDSDVTRYGLFRYGGSVSQDWRVSRGVRLFGALDLHRMTFGDPHCCGESSLADLPTLPPGFGAGYTAFTERIEATFDSRPPLPAPQDGVRVRLTAAHGSDLSGDADWLSAGATVGGFWDVASLGRIIGVTVTAEVAEPLSGEVPFLELVALGGNGLAMPGLRPDRLLGSSALSLSLRYQWPVWAFMGGVLQTEVGNVFGPRFDGFDVDLLRLSIALGFRTTGAPDHTLQLLVGVGTETFAQGAALTSVRLSFGGTYGF